MCIHDTHLTLELWKAGHCILWIHETHLTLELWKAGHCQRFILCIHETHLTLEPRKTATVSGLSSTALADRDNYMWGRHRQYQPQIYAASLHMHVCTHYFTTTQQHRAHQRGLVGCGGHRTPCDTLIHALYIHPTRVNPKEIVIGHTGNEIPWGLRQWWSVLQEKKGIIGTDTLTVDTRREGIFISTPLKSYHNHISYILCIKIGCTYVYVISEFTSHTNWKKTSPIIENFCHALFIRKKVHTVCVWSSSTCVRACRHTSSTPGRYIRLRVTWTIQTGISATHNRQMSCSTCEMNEC